MSKKDIIFFIDSPKIRDINKNWPQEDKRERLLLKQNNFVSQIRFEELRSALLVVNRDELRGDSIAFLNRIFGNIEGGFGIIPVYSLEKTTFWLKRRFEKKQNDSHYYSIAIYNSFNIDLKKCKIDPIDISDESDTGIFWGHGRNYCLFGGLACASPLSDKKECIASMKCPSDEFMRIQIHSFNHRHVVLATCQAAHIPKSPLGDVLNIAELFLWGKATSVIAAYYITRFIRNPVLAYIYAFYSSGTIGEISYKMNILFNSSDKGPTPFVLLGDPKEEMIQKPQLTKVTINSIIGKKHKKRIDTSKYLTMIYLVSQLFKTRNSNNTIHKDLKKIFILMLGTALPIVHNILFPSKRITLSFLDHKCEYCNHWLLEEQYWCYPYVGFSCKRIYATCLNCGLQYDKPIDDIMLIITYSVLSNGNIKVSVSGGSTNKVVGVMFPYSEAFGITPTFQIEQLTHSHTLMLDFFRKKEGLNHLTKLDVLAIGCKGITWIERFINPMHVCREE